MAVRHSLQKNGDRCHRQEKTRSQTPKVAGSSASPYQPDCVYPVPSSSAMEVGNSMDASASTWHHQPHICTQGPLMEEKPSIERGTISHTSEELVVRAAYLSPPIPPHDRNIPEELAQIIIIRLIPAPDGPEEIAEAFLEAPDLPPITKQSLSELDIQSIITNIKLRHDINFDRDLSFRPNLDGAKGQQKTRARLTYESALIAELELYARLFQGAPPLRGFEQTSLEVLTHHAERRIPKLFQTIRDVLKSLVPDRDHSRVDEHLDVSMLMQEIERGVCDLVRLAEWMAHLLKEHCAPMRDVMVDQMVKTIGEGVTRYDLERSKKVAKGLMESLGILEAMKLDVANHQIRKLKSLLVEDTVNFETHYHLDRLVNFRSRVNINAAQDWYADATENFGSECTLPRRDAPSFQLEVFTRAVVATLFSRNPCSDFPEIFYLDHDRLRILKAEIDDMIYFEACMELFAILTKQLGYHGPISLAVGQQLRTSILAIMGEAMSHGSQQWMMNSEALSLEILRQASRVAGRSPTSHFDLLADANQHLRILFDARSGYYAANLEQHVLSQIFHTIDRHTASSPMELFNNLVPISPSMPPPGTYPSQPLASDTSALYPESAKLCDLANRIAHIIILHWRVWNRIAYVPTDETPQVSAQSADEVTPRSSISQPPSQSSRALPPLLEETTHVVTTMKTGEPPESGQEAHIAHQTPSR